MWHVDANVGPLRYSVTLDPPDCTCVAFAINNNKLKSEGKEPTFECKHIKKVRDRVENK